MSARALVVAKAPVAGRVKTRLGADVGADVAARLAAAALLDTVTACEAAFGAEACLLAMAGDLDDAVDGDLIADAVSGWSLARQRGVTFAERLVNAHLDAPPGEPVVQVGMDTPQLTPVLLHAVAAGLVRNDAVLAPAEDGGWWALGLRRRGGATALHDVAMSTPTTYDDTRRALEERGLGVASAPVLRDVDTYADAEAVAASAPGTAFAAAWREVR